MQRFCAPIAVGCELLVNLQCLVKEMTYYTINPLPAIKVRLKKDLNIQPATLFENAIPALTGNQGIWFPAYAGSLGERFSNEI